jgi:serine/threonine-protein kinase
MVSLAQGTMPRIPHARIDARTYSVGETKIVFETADIASVRADAIVNSAYSDMKMRAGVGDALRRRGGDSIEDEAAAGGERALGSCVRTGAGHLQCRAVLHAVGGWKEVSCVARATQHALLQAEELGCPTVAIPAIGTGQGQISVESCADAMIGALRQHLVLGGSRLREVRFVLYDEPTLDRFMDVAVGVLLGTDDLGSTHDEDAGAHHDSETGTAPTLSAPPRIQAYTPTQKTRSDQDPSAGE